MKIWNEILLIDKLRKEHKLTAEEYKILLECQDSNCLSYLQSKLKRKPFPGSVIEFSSAAS